MIRVRFFTKSEDYRPIKFPPPGPYWCTGGPIDAHTIVAYFENEAQIKEFWPEAFDIDIHRENCEPTFTGRFPKPDWWTK